MLMMFLKLEAEELYFLATRVHHRASMKGVVSKLSISMLMLSVGSQTVEDNEILEVF